MSVPIALTLEADNKELSNNVVTIKPECKIEDNSKGNIFSIVKTEKWNKATINGDNMSKAEPEKKRYFFADEIKINDQTVLTIPLENQFYEEEKPKRKSRWGDKPEKKSNFFSIFFFFFYYGNFIKFQFFLIFNKIIKPLSK